MANTLKNIVDFNNNISIPSNQQGFKAEESNSSSLIIECDEILKLIPHRYPMLLIDRVKDVKLNESAVGIKNVSMNEQFFQGHFPAKPIMPGVLIIEAMAQTAAVLVVKSMGTECADKLVYFMSVEEARFRKPVTPGDQLELKVTKIKERGLIWKFKGEAYVNGQLTDEAIFTAMIAENNNK